MLVIFSDLDGTLLHRDTYSFEPAREALQAIHDRGVALVASTSKTRAELEPIRAELPCGYHPYIAENGAIVGLPSSYFPFRTPNATQSGEDDIVRFGSSYASIVSDLRHASQTVGASVSGFADMTAVQISALTGLTLDQAERARQREHDEPFLILDEERAPLLLNAIEQAGRRWSQGGRFYHINDPVDKGIAAVYLTDCYHRAHKDVTSVGLGDAPNDIPLLRACERQIIIRSSETEAMRAELPNAVVTSKPGPGGWNEAVLRILGS